MGRLFSSNYEGGIAAELAERVDEILGEGVEEGESSLIAIGFVKLGDGAEVAAGGGEGIGGRETAAFVVGGEEREVGGDLGIEFGGGAAPAQQARQENAQGGHGSLSSRRAIMATVRDQLLVSAASCLRPARVME